MSRVLDGLGRRVRARAERLGRRAAYRPDRFCFVSGSYRSGTTAAADWLGRQHDAASFSESRLTMAAHAMMSEVRRFKKLHADEPAIAAEVRQMLFGYYAKRSGGRRPGLLVDKEPLGPIGLPERNHGEFLRSVRRLFPDGRLILMSRGPVPTLWSMTQRDYGHSLVEGPVRHYSLEEHLENWCATAEAILGLAGEPGVYVCSFERLTADPADESRRLGDFLGIGSVVPFEPRPTKEPAFSDADRETIEARTGTLCRSLDAAVDAQRREGAPS